MLCVHLSSCQLTVLPRKITSLHQVDPRLLRCEEWLPTPFSIFVLFVMCLRLPSQPFLCSRAALGSGTGCRLKHRHMCDWSENLCSSGVSMDPPNSILFARMSSGWSVAAVSRCFRIKKGVCRMLRLCFLVLHVLEKSWNI